MIATNSYDIYDWMLANLDRLLAEKPFGQQRLF